MTDRIKLAEMDYLSGMKYKDIAKKYDVSINTVKSWKRRCNWIRGKGATINATKKKSVHTKTKKVADRNKTDDIDNSAQEELFCQLVGGQRLPMYQAYDIAFPNKKRKINSSMVQASVLAKRKDIQLRILKISEDTAAKYEWSIDKVIASLTFVNKEAKASIIKNGLNKANSDAMINSIDRIVDVLNLKEIDKAQLRKLNADADVSEAKAKQLKEGTSLDGVTIQFVRSDREEEKDSEND